MVHCMDLTSFDADYSSEMDGIDIAFRRRESQADIAIILSSFSRAYGRVIKVIDF